MTMYCVSGKVISSVLRPQMALGKKSGLWVIIMKSNQECVVILSGKDKQLYSFTSDLRVPLSAKVEVKGFYSPVELPLHKGKAVILLDPVFSLVANGQTLIDGEPMNEHQRREKRAPKVRPVGYDEDGDGWDD
ncbi:hypothetical protein UFOVP380_54 [uncultured Caudovirales phage]|uniref:Uncharacterized protein n=1 Tax=uncultured Caudovirales phage TaxID=2100421 RepID=A0A6J7X359_9CAUD|nr:hypothetical protein UFOVP380_54 [uncultured Caudovirales phage]